MRSLFLALCLSVLPVTTLADLVKLSRSGICHDKASPSYDRTKNYEAFSDLNNCLSAGGRLPENRSPTYRTSSLNTDAYDRTAFRHWNGSCPNTRHEILLTQSTAVNTTFTNDKQCTVERGKWLDLYSGDTHYVARDLDVDHVVPLAYSWERGSKHWDTQKRERFANDNANLVITSATLNRQKGARGPAEWLPPREGFRCQYPLRFDRVMKTYGLQYEDWEKPQIEAAKARYCRL